MGPLHELWANLPKISLLYDFGDLIQPHYELNVDLVDLNWKCCYDKKY